MAGELTNSASAAGLPGFLRAAELVELAERVYRDTFRAGLWVALATAVYGLALVFVQVGRIDRPLAAAICVALAAGLLVASRRHKACYEMLRRRPVGAIALGAILAVAHALVGAGSQVLFPLSLVVIGVLATTVSTRVLCAAGLLAGAAQASGAIRYELAANDEQAVLAAGAALVFAPLLFSALVERLARFMLDLHAASTDAAPPRAVPIRVAVWADCSPRAARVLGAHISRAWPVPVPAVNQEPPSTSDPPVTLTARQLEVVALASEGLRHEQIAACLAIRPGQVTRHLTNARSRVDVDTTEQLVSWALGTGIIAPPGPR